MKIPKQIKTLLKQRENYATKYIAYESKLNDWLYSKGMFYECTCGDHSCLFNTGVEVFNSGSAATTIEYLESLKD